MTQGPLINEEAVEKAERLIAQATASGAKIVLGGRRSALGGTFFEPTVVTEVTPEMDIAKEEIFGPVATLFRFRDEAEAIRIANATDFGLAAYFYARDIGRVMRVAEAAGIRHGRNQRRHHLDRGRAVRRDQAIRHRPRGARNTGSRNISRSNTCLLGGL